ncbi:GD16073 [Drosophila simulans]|uniref:GD16073 n=1 Tax=Drosophila simulans TaxID=7240 RepID=B4R6W3_DROSI|nr:GD16073 [Drosophila simulans]
MDFIIRLSQKLNLEFEIVAPEVGHMGELNEMGEWDGVVGDLVRGETEFAIAALKMYSEREEVMEFLPPYYEQTGISIAIRKPVRRTSLFKFMTVLRLEVWLSIVAALVGTAIMIWFMDKYSPYSSRNNRQAYPVCLPRVHPAGELLVRPYVVHAAGRRRSTQGHFRTDAGGRLLAVCRAHAGHIHGKSGCFPHRGAHADAGPVAGATGSTVKDKLHRGEGLRYSSILREHEVRRGHAVPDVEGAGPQC